MNLQKLKLELIEQKNLSLKDIYHFLQVNFAYNSNKIKGEKLTEEIFEPDSFIHKSDEVIKHDDLIEMKNHFRLFDYILNIIDSELTKDNIIEMNKIFIKKYVKNY